jgi:PelA/Pel-15E family pectate lyase
MKRQTFSVLVILLATLPSQAAKKASKSDGGPRQYLDKPDDWFAGPDAKEIATNILSYQSSLGGWPKNVDTTAKLYDGDPARLKPTFDNKATVDELRFLARAFDVTKEPKYQAAVEKGVDYILKAQYPSGGWPQFYPPDNSYHRYITFNDDVMVRVMELLRDTYTSDRFAFLDAARKKSAKTEFDLGVQCILKCQIKVDGKLTAWCAQHDEKTFAPTPGRSFELTSISGSESVGVVELLMSLDDPSPQVIQSIQSAIAWFESAKLPGIKVDQEDAPDTIKGHDRVVVPDASAPPMWARFYDIKTNKPIFSDRDGIPKAELAEIGDERRNGYRWLDYWPQPLLDTEYPAWKAKWATKLAVPTTQQ